ncbi:MAG: HAMP domain-containing sensor histidine kinase [Emergencia sp.]|nr:HAMP domain-containing sensor histidine kinase [Emergencia sp.]
MIKMKNSSIRKRVTLYYSIVLVLITLLVFGVFLMTASRQVNTVSKDTVMKAVQSSFENVDYENEVLEIDNDFDSYHKGVILLVYSEDGQLIKGSAPGGFPAYTPLSSATYQEIEDGRETWLVYDLFNSYENGQGIWVRGIYDMDSTLRTLNAVKGFMYIVLPVMLLCAILAGRRITRKAFEPVAEITRAADSINNGMDLSKRLPQGEAKDELYGLTETLNRMIERLENAFQAEKEFSSDVSHELKTPISVILTECEYTLEENRTNDEYRESIETIQQQCRRTMSLIQQLLQMSRTINTDKIIDREQINLSLLCESISEELSFMAEEKGVRLLTSIEKDIEIFADETLMMRLIINLITNGIKYRREDADSFVRLTLTSGESKILIKTEDNGIGISKEDCAHIFNRFYKVDKSRTESSTEGDTSFGLGLSMVKWIAEAHQGKASVKSTMGKGSVFTVVLPKKQSDSSDIL